MEYKPLKKTIRFSQEVQNNPHFTQMKMLLRACGDKKFKDWLIGYIDSYNKDAPYFDLMQKIKRHLFYLISRESNLNDHELSDCKTYFYPEPNIEIVCLFEQALTFFCELQDMERAIQKMTDEFSADKQDSNQIKEPINMLPRNAVKKGVRYK